MDAMDAGMPAGVTRCGDETTPIVQEHPAPCGQGPQQNPALPGMRVRIPFGVMIDVNSRRESRCGCVVWSWRWWR